MQSFIKAIADFVTPKMPGSLDYDHPQYEYVKQHIDRAKTVSKKYRIFLGRVFLVLGVLLGLFFIHLRIRMLPVGWLFFLPVALFLISGSIFLGIGRNLS